MMISTLWLLIHSRGGFPSELVEIGWVGDPAEISCARVRHSVGREEPSDQNMNQAISVHHCHPIRTSKVWVHSWATVLRPNTNILMKGGDGFGTLFSVTLL